MEFAVVRAIFIIIAFLQLVGAQHGGMGGMGGDASSTSKKGICPSYEGYCIECPDDVVDYCTRGDDSTCADDLKCCYTGCEYDCLVPDPAPVPPPRKIGKDGDPSPKRKKGQDFKPSAAPLSPNMSQVPLQGRKNKPGICPKVDKVAECPDGIEDFCREGDDSTCADDLKCCYAGCEFDCMVPDPAPVPPPRKGSAGNEGERAENGPPGPPGPPGSK